MRTPIFPVALTVLSHTPRTSASSVMEDIVRVPINTDDGPAFILLGTTGDRASKSNHKTPEGIILVKQSLGGLQVDFVASEILPEDMKTGLLDKIENLGLTSGVYVHDRNISEEDPESVYPSLSDSAALSQGSSETTEGAVSQSPVAEQSEASFASSNDETDAYEEKAQYLSSTDSPPGLSSLGSLASSNTTSTHSPQSHIRDSTQNQSGKLNGQGQRSSSTKNADELSSACVVTISMGVFVLIMVGVM